MTALDDARTNRTPEDPADYLSTGELALLADEAAAEALTAEQIVDAVRNLAIQWAYQSTDYDDDTEQQIEDGRTLLRLINGGETS